MKYSTIVLAIFSGIAVAQSSLPECAQPCIAKAVPEATDCTIEDQACQCLPANKAAIQKAATTCVITACKEKAIEVLTAADEACKNLPAPAESTTESSAAAAPTTSAYVAPEPATTASTTATTSATVIVVVPSTTPKPSSNGTTTVVTPSPPAPTSSIFAGGAGSIAASVGSVFAIGMAVAAAL